MITAKFERIPSKCGGGYARWEDDGLCVFVNRRDNPERQRLTTIHEVLDAYLGGEVSHKRLDKIGISIIEALTQLGFVR